MEAQRIIITGGATRIGAAIAEKLSGPNKQIIIHYNKSKAKAENLKKKLQKDGLMKELKLRQYYRKPSEIKREKKKQGIKNYKKKMAKLQREL